jgi:hypothetical protein
MQPMIATMAKAVSLPNDEGVLVNSVGRSPAPWANLEQREYQRFWQILQVRNVSVPLSASTSPFLVMGFLVTTAIIGCNLFLHSAYSIK